MFERKLNTVKKNTNVTQCLIVRTSQLLKQDRLKHKYLSYGSPEDMHLTILTSPCNCNLCIHDWFQVNNFVQNKDKLEILIEEDYMAMLSEMQIGQKMGRFYVKP